MKKQLLTLSALACLSAGVAQTTLVSANFTGQTLPAGWTNDSLGQAGTMLWRFTNPGVRAITGAGFDADFAILDSDNFGSGNSQDATLTTPSFSTVGYTAVSLSFGEQFRYYNPSHHEISYSINGGASWVSIRKDSADLGYPNPAVLTTLNLPAGALNQANVKIKFNYQGTWGWWWAIDNVVISGLNNCTGTPNAGTIQGLPPSACANVPYDLTLSGATGDVGISYQWMFSTNGSSFSPIAGATGLTLHDSTATVPVFYAVIVTCSGGGADTTPVVSMTSLNPATMCYCVPVHPTCGADFITRVAIPTTTLNNGDSICNNAGNGAYSTYPATGNTTATLTTGATYTLNVTTTSNDIVSVWIDYDKNGVFDASEWNQVCTTSTAGVANSVTFTVPGGATTGVTGMRVRSRLNGNPNGSTDACTQMGSGECEDYFVTLALPLGIDENSLEGFGLYPNPAKNMVRISVPEKSTGHVAVVIFDIAGNQVVSTSSASHSVDVDVDNLADGIYFVRLSDGKNIATKKIVIAK